MWVEQEKPEPCRHGRGYGHGASTRRTNHRAAWRERWPNTAIPFQPYRLALLLRLQPSAFASDSARTLTIRPAFCRLRHSECLQLQFLRLRSRLFESAFCIFGAPTLPFRTMSPDRPALEARGNVEGWAASGTSVNNLQCIEGHVCKCKTLV